MRLDVGTLALSTATVSLALAATIVFVAAGKGNRQTRLCFSASNALYGIGLLMIVFLPAAAPVCANTLVMISALCAHRGACIYAGTKINPIYYGITLLFVVVGLYSSLSGELGGVPIRIYLLSAARIPFFVHAAYVLFARKGGIRMSAPSKLLFIAFASFSFVLIVRAVNISLSSITHGVFTEWIGFQSAYYLIVSVIMLSMTIAFSFMCAEEDEAHLRETIERRTEELREAKHVAEQASAAKTRFIAAAGHDLRQPVHTLRLLASAAMGLVPKGHEELGDLISEVKKSTARLADYLHMLLDISKLDSGAIVPNIRDVMIGDLFRELDVQFRQEADAVDVRLRFVTSSAMVRTDPFLLKRILSNLISNAIKFAEGGAVLVGCRRRNGSIEIQVCDNGCGMDGDAIPYIFDEFRQIGNDARQAAKGLGLGLAIVQRLCLLLNITTYVHSKKGIGSVFGVIIDLEADVFPE